VYVAALWCGLAVLASPARGDVSAGGPLHIDGIAFHTGDQVRSHQLGGGSSLDLTEWFQDENDLFEMRAVVEPLEGGRAASLAFTSHAYGTWGGSSVYTLTCVAPAAGDLVLSGVDEWFERSGGLTASVTVMLGRDGEQLLGTVGDSVWVEAGSPLTLVVTMSWDHHWPESAVGWVELDFVTIPAPGCVVLLLAAARRRRC